MKDYTYFIISVEDGSITEEYFLEHAQGFVDSGIWRCLQGSWQRAVQAWADAEIVTINQISS
jgi:uncharacterized cupin superfamily protein